MSNTYAQDCEPLVATDRTGITDEDIKYYHNLQKYAHDKREELHEQMSPEEIQQAKQELGI